MTPLSSFQSPTKPRGRGAGGGISGDGGSTGGVCVGRGGGGLGRGVGGSGVGGSGGFSLDIGGGIRGAKRKVELTRIFDPANTVINATSDADESTLSAFDGSQPQHSGPGQPKIQT